MTRTTATKASIAIQELSSKALREWRQLHRSAHPRWGRNRRHRSQGATAW